MAAKGGWGGREKEGGGLQRKFEQTPLTVSPASFWYTRRFTHRDTCRPSPDQCAAHDGR